MWYAEAKHREDNPPDLTALCGCIGMACILALLAGFFGLSLLKYLG